MCRFTGAESSADVQASKFKREQRRLQSDGIPQHARKRSRRIARSLCPSAPPWRRTRFGRAEVGHVHNNGIVDIPFHAQFTTICWQKASPSNPLGAEFRWRPSMSATKRTSNIRSGCCGFPICGTRKRRRFRRLSLRIEHSGASRCSTASYLRTSDQDSDCEHQSASHDYLQRGRYERHIHVTVPHPADDCPVRSTTTTTAAVNASVKIWIRNGERVSEPAAVVIAPVTSPAVLVFPAAGKRTIVRERFRKRHGNARAQRRRHANQNASQVLCVARAAAKIGARVETDPPSDPRVPAARFAA